MPCASNAQGRIIQTRGRKTMRTALFLGGLLLATMAGNGGTFAQGAWCLVDDAGRTNCAYATQQQCLATSRGDGGFCQQNKGYYTNKDPLLKRRRDQRRYESGGTPN